MDELLIDLRTSSEITAADLDRLRAALEAERESSRREYGEHVVVRAEGPSSRELQVTSIVFDTYELLVLILAHLDWQDLFDARGVSRHFRHIVLGAGSLRTKLFLRSIPVRRPVLASSITPLPMYLPDISITVTQARGLPAVRIVVAPAWRHSPERRGLLFNRIRGDFLVAQPPPQATQLRRICGCQQGREIVLHAGHFPVPGGRLTLGVLLNIVAPVEGSCVACGQEMTIVVRGFI